MCVIPAHNLADARRIVEEARAAKTIVAVAENWSYHSLVRAVGKYVQQGGIGEVIIPIEKINAISDNPHTIDHQLHL